jgi:hypothetical protein
MAEASQLDETSSSLRILCMNDVYEEFTGIGRKCKLCEKVVETPNKGTSGLRDHAKRKHNVSIPLMRNPSNKPKKPSLYNF